MPPRRSRRWFVVAHWLTWATALWAAQPTEPEAGHAWWKQLQVYGMVPLPVEVARASNTTVNRLAAGIFSVSPVRMWDTESAYPDDGSYVQAAHSAGMKVSCYVPGVGGRPRHMQAYPQLDGAQC